MLFTNRNDSNTYYVVTFSNPSVMVVGFMVGVQSFGHD